MFFLQKKKRRRKRKKKEHSLFEQSSYNYLTWEELAGCLLVESFLAHETGETPAVWCGDRNAGLGEGTSALFLRRLYFGGRAEGLGWEGLGVSGMHYTRLWCVAYCQAFKQGGERSKPYEHLLHFNNT